MQPIQCQSSADLIPIWGQSSTNLMQILGQSIPNLMSIQRQWIPNPVPICFQFQCKIQYQSRANSSPNRFQSIQPILCQSDIYPKAIFQSSANLMPIKCQSIANLMPIPYWSYVNPRPIWCQWCQSDVYPLSILYHSGVNPVPILCRSNTIPELPILINDPINSQSAANLMSFSVHPMPIQRQSSTNPAPI